MALYDLTPEQLRGIWRRTIIFWTAVALILLVCGAIISMIIVETIAYLCGDDSWLSAMFLCAVLFWALYRYALYRFAGEERQP